MCVNICSTSTNRSTLIRPRTLSESSLQMMMSSPKTELPNGRMFAKFKSSIESNFHPDGKFPYHARTRLGRINLSGGINRQNNLVGKWGAFAPVCISNSASFVPAVDLLMTPEGGCTHSRHARELTPRLHIDDFIFSSGWNRVVPILIDCSRFVSICRYVT